MSGTTTLPVAPAVGPGSAGSMSMTTTVQQQGQPSTVTDTGLFTSDGQVCVVKTAVVMIYETATMA